jgi:O-acetyl-ADP-ribose deacetylase (regulator of RNase III)
MEFYNKLMNGPDMLNKTKGNLITLAEQGWFDVIVQGCNCFNTMGSGIAREIREKYPQAYAVDCETWAGDYGKLGSYTVMLGKEVRVPFDIVNAYTQYDFSRGKDVFEYVSFAMILQKLAHEYPTRNFGFPYIGCGLAGGDTEVIMAMLEDFAKTISKTGGSVTLVEFA